MITNRTTPIPITVALLISFDSVSAVMKKPLVWHRPQQEFFFYNTL
jgi:hypothetical protein